jgi:hypothetical protein
MRVKLYPPKVDINPDAWASAFGLERRQVHDDVIVNLNAIMEEAVEKYLQSNGFGEVRK